MCTDKIMFKKVKVTRNQGIPFQHVYVISSYTTLLIRAKRHAPELHNAPHQILLESSLWGYAVSLAARTMLVKAVSFFILPSEAKVAGTAAVNE